MQISPETFEVAISVVGGIVAGAVGWTKMSGKVDTLEKTDGQQWDAINELRKWRDNFKEDFAVYKLDIEKDLGRIKEHAVAGSGKLDSILDKVLAIERKIDRLELRNEKVDKSKDKEE